MPRVFISSTSELAEHRKKLANWIIKKGDGWSAIFQDGGLAATETPLRTSLKMVEQSDLVIVLVGRLYGSIPKGERKSFCELEYEAAVRLKKPCLAFVIDEREHNCLPEHLTLIGENPEQFTRQRLFRQRICADLNVGDEPFKSIDNLVTNGVQGIEAYFRTYMAQKKLDTSQGIDRSRFLVPKPPTLFAPFPYCLQSGHFVGRTDELKALSTWADEGKDPVLALTALGGAGKSALAWNWVQECLSGLSNTFEGVFWWSFYDDNSFERCVALLLAYVTHCKSGETLERSFDLNVSDLLSHLHERRFLICLDGVERVLRGYRELDITQGASDLNGMEGQNAFSDFDAEYVGDNSLSMGQSEYRQAIGKLGKFLFQLPTLKMSRVLCSTRLFPQDFELDGVVRKGVVLRENMNLSDTDALEILKANKVRGKQSTLLSLSNAVGNHPLTLRILSGEVTNNSFADGDLDNWLSRHPDFDPYRLEVRQRRRHVLLFALRGLRARTLAVLGAIAAFRGPASIADLEKILLSENGLLSSVADLENAIADLRDRHLVGWVSGRGEFDMHPIVRGVSWTNFDRRAQERLATLHGEHFETIAAKTNMSASDRFYTLQQRFFSLIERRRPLEAFALIDDKVSADALKNGKTQDCADMLEACLDGGSLEKILIDGIDNQIRFFQNLGFYYSYCNRPHEMLHADFQSLALKVRHPDKKLRRLEKLEVFNLVVGLKQNGYISQARKLANLNREQWIDDFSMCSMYGEFNLIDGEYDAGLEILFKHALYETEDEPASWGHDRFTSCKSIIDCILNSNTNKYDLQYARKITVLALQIARRHQLSHEILIAETIIDQIQVFSSISLEQAIWRMEARLESVRQRNLVLVEFDIVARLLVCHTQTKDFERGEVIAQDCIALLKFANIRNIKLSLSLAIARYYDVVGDNSSAYNWATIAQTFALQPDGSPGAIDNWREAGRIAVRNQTTQQKADFPYEGQEKSVKFDINVLVAHALSLSRYSDRKVSR